MCTTLVVVYLFNPIIAGELGIVISTAGFLAMIISFERYVSLQIGSSKSSSINQKVLSSAIASILMVFMFVSSFLVSLNYFLEFFTYPILLLLLLISLVESLLNLGYNLALVDIYFYSAVKFSAVKNIFYLISVFFFYFLQHEISVFNVLVVWFIISLITLHLLMNRYKLKISNFFKLSSLKHNLYLSSSHFIIGLIAYLSVIVDKYVCSFYFSEYNLGIYYRHISLMSLMLQTGTIWLLHPNLERIIRLTAQVRLKELRRLELSIVLKMVFFAFFVFLVSAYLIRSFSIVWAKEEVLFLLLIVGIFKFFGDIKAYELNCYYLGKELIIHRIASLLVFLFVFAAMGSRLGIVSLVYSLLISSVFFLVSTTLLTSKHENRLP